MGTAIAHQPRRLGQPFDVLLLSEEPSPLEERLLLKGRLRSDEGWLAIHSPPNVSMMISYPVPQTC
jgi:hypothetical protein